MNYLRSLPEHKGTKEGCAEGDCGACTVVLGELIHKNKIRYRAVDSCLLFLPMLHGKQVITIENLKSPEGMLHPVQQAMVNTHGSQCGFCTPGIVMSLFAMYKRGLTLSRTEIEENLSGNLCRCTGYAPILEAAQIIGKENNNDHFSKNEKLIGKLLHQIKRKSLSLTSGKHKYFCPCSLKEALILRKKHPKALLLCGATDVALRVTKNHEILSKIIDLSHIETLKGITAGKKSYKIMAGSTFSEIKDVCKDHFPALFAMISVFGSEQIRNLATIGGNLATASPIGDLAPILMAYNATVELASKRKKRSLPLEEFISGYRKTACRHNEIITAIQIPYNKNSVQIRFYKFSKRKDLDISTVSAGFRLRLTNEKKIRSVKLAYGGLSNMTKRANKTENFLRNKVWSKENVLLAGKFLEKEFSPITDARASAEGRMLAAKNLLLKFYNDTIFPK